MAKIQERFTFFQAGGTLSLEATYVERSADEQLRQATLAGEYCNVLTARQMGKSSLMIRTMTYLEQHGVRTASLDLTDIGVEVDAGKWYFGLVSRLKTAFDLMFDENTWWGRRTHQGVVQRFSDFLRDVILEEITEPIVIFVDEIDSTLELTFADDFFAAIRAAYNARATDPVFKRLSFVLLGVTRPTDLIKDRERTPYNIGTSIDLTDFTLAEARILLPGLETISDGQAERILSRILHWTGGHPYLTQKVCSEITSNPTDSWNDEAVDKQVKRLFISDEARKESNLQYINDRLLENEDRSKLLRVYQQVYAGKEVLDEERDTIKSQLKLAGVVKVEAGKLIVRNPIYLAVFDAKWIQDNMPRVTTTKVTFVAVIITIIALLIGGWLLIRQPIVVAQERAQTITDVFLGSQADANLRLANLADFFALKTSETIYAQLFPVEDYQARARKLFFDLPPNEQLSLFNDLNNPNPTRLRTVIEGLYTDLDPVNEHDRMLLEAMANQLSLVTGQDDPLLVEINAMLK